MKIGGRDFEQVMKDFQAPFGEKDFDDRDGNFFIPHAVWEKRINDTIGLSNYIHDVKNTSVEKIGEGYVLLGESTLSIIDDDGVIVKSVVYPCGADIIVAASSDKCTNFSNSTERLYQNSLGKGCKFLGVGAEQLRSKKPKNGKNKGSNSNKSGETKEYVVTFKSKISALGSSGYKANVSLEGKADVEMVMFKEAIGSIERVVPISTFLSKYGPGKSLTITGYEKEFNGKPQIVMESVSQKAS